MNYWENCWKNENVDELFGFLDKYNGLDNDLVRIFNENNLHFVCDCGCGFGAYSLLLKSQGFQVKSFDISEKSVEITKDFLNRYNYDVDVTAADILSTPYSDNEFDGIVAHAIIDHLTKVDAIRAISELSRITKENGLIYLSFDVPSEDDYLQEYIEIEHGTMLYQNGMIFHPYNEEEIHELLKDYEIIFNKIIPAREYQYIIRKK